jgi:leucyl aminopeptidase (aminopeptidase T)
MFSTNPNKQYSYDHRYDYALYYDKEYVALKEQAFEKYVKVYADKLKAQGGPALLEVFGEKPFSPKTTVQNLSLDDKQTSLNKSSQIAIQKIINPYLSREEYSFTIVSYPIPEIGEQFEEIFDATIEVNTLDANMYERIQQTIIDALDEGEYVHVKGKGSNKTDIMVNLYELNDREKETRFHNCLADVNIPVGEVYTSPVLTGTNGTLFVKEVYLKGLKYENLEIVFKDGYIDSYTCSNFDVEEENKKFVYENLMLPHKTLPLGEFAIGTNTTAYVMANKYNILDILPILITEKMGPHFAIGDTCFLWSEDVPVYNSNGKEVIARDNEKSILRKTNIEEAYTGLHTDITIPYNELDSIDIVLKNGDKIGIINNGRFVLEGTQELNKALDKLD